MQFYLFCEAPSCDSVPSFNNSVANNDKSFYGVTITYECIDEYLFIDQSALKAITCIGNETTGYLYWRGGENMTCVPAMCPSSADFTAVQGVTYITPNQSSYGIGNSVSYKCPNGIKRNAICSWDITLKIAYWIYWGRCSGEILV